MSDWGQFIDISPDRSKPIVYNRHSLPTILECDMEQQSIMYDDFVRTNSGELFNNNINKNLNGNLDFHRPIISFIYCIIYWFKHICK